MYTSLPESFSVKLVLNSDVIADLQAERPSEQMISQLSLSFSEEVKPNTLIKIKALYLSEANSKEKKKKGRPPKNKRIEDSPIDEFVDDLNEPELLDLDDEEPLNDMELDDLPDEEDPNNVTSFSSEKGGEKKLTKRQMYQIKGQGSAENLEAEPLLSLPDKVSVNNNYFKRGRNKKNIILTEEEIQRRNLKDQERKLKLQKQIEEHKQQTVDKILNEVGRKHKQRQEIEQQEIKGKQLHKFKELPKEEIIIKYKSTVQGQTVSFPSILNQFFQDQSDKNKIQQEKTQKCSNTACQKKYKYRIPKSNLFACGLECYKRLVSID